MFAHFSNFFLCLRKTTKKSKKLFKVPRKKHFIPETYLPRNFRKNCKHIKNNHPSCYTNTCLVTLRRKNLKRVFIDNIFIYM